MPLAGGGGGREGGVEEVVVVGGVACIMMAGSGVPGREGRGGVIEGEEMPQGRRWGSEELLKG